MAGLGRTNVPDNIDQYEIRTGTILGQGAFGIVYLGRDTVENEDVAIKVLNPPANARAPYHIKYIQREVALLPSVDHQNIVRALHWKQVDSRFYIAFELCTCNLQDFATANGITQSDKEQILLDMSAAVRYLHQKGIIHRDLKPENILVKVHEDRNVFKLSDLGLSRRIPGEAASSVSVTPGVGTQQWMAPEMFARCTRYSVEADYYSFGLLTASVVEHVPGNSLAALSGEDNMYYGQWLNHLSTRGQPFPSPFADSPGDSEETRAIKRLAARMIKYKSSERCTIEEAYWEIRRIYGRQDTETESTSGDQSTTDQAGTTGPSDDQHHDHAGHHAGHHADHHDSSPGNVVTHQDDSVSEYFHDPNIAQEVEGATAFPSVPPPKSRNKRPVTAHPRSHSTDIGNTSFMRMDVQPEYITLYHYTTPDGAQGIASSKRINQATQRAFLGQGVYFSDLLVGRDCTKEAMARINYGQGPAAVVKMRQDYIERVVEVTLLLSQVRSGENVGRPNVWVYPGAYLDLNKHRYSIRQV